MTTTFHLTLMMTSAQVVGTSVTLTDNSPSQDYTHPDDQITLLHVSLKHESNVHVRDQMLLVTEQVLKERDNEALYSV